MVTEPLTKPALVAVDMRPARRGERLFKLAASAAGSTIVIAILLIAIFLLVRAVPSLRANHANFFTSTQFDTSDDEQLAFGVRDLFMVTALSSITALVLAVPVAVGIAVFLTHYAPRRLSRPFGAMVDLLAAVPSIIFGLWGIFVLAPKLEPIARFLNRNLGWLFLFKQGNVSLAGGGTIFTAGIVLSVMILPIVTSISREVFRQTPLIQIEAALALGATKWEVVRMTVLPYGRSGVVAASMLGLGRALGETVAVLVILRSAARPGTTVDFPAVPGALGENGNGGMVTGCAETPGCVAYIGISFLDQASQRGLGEAQLGNSSGNFLLPDAQSIQAAAAGFASKTPANQAISMIDGPAPDGYPIINYEYAIVNNRQKDAATAQTLQAFLHWAITDGNKASFLDQVHFQPLPPAVVKLSDALIATISS